MRRVPDTVVIEERFCGPAGSANGGYACAIAGQWLDGPAEVTLRVPPPLGRPLTVQRDGVGVSLLDGEVVVATAVPATVDVDVPDPVSYADAERAASRYPWRDAHPYPTCFVCGPERAPGDGLGIFPGPVDGRAVFAAPWTPDAGLADATGDVREPFAWAALDCPSGIVTDRFGDVGRILLGRLAVDLRAPVRAQAPHVVQAWTVARDGRKLHTASAVFTAEGELCGVARAVWIAVRESAPQTAE